LLYDTLFCTALFEAFLSLYWAQIRVLALRANEDKSSILPFRNVDNAL
jgi:hypothetical protein